MAIEPSKVAARRAGPASIAAVLGEIALPERAFVDGRTLDGPIDATLLVENLGAFTDLPVFDGWLVVHVPGWDTATVSRLLNVLPKVPVVHFGDLDPNGVSILQHLRQAHPSVGWFVPEFWAEMIGTTAQHGCWPEDLDPSGTPRLVQDLAARGLWLEQESLVVDKRLPMALSEMLQ